MKSTIRIGSLTICLFFLAAATAWSQTTGQILGRVLDEDSQEPVVAADLLVEGTDIRTISSDDGEFILVSIPVGEHRLRVERIGFQTLIQLVHVRPGRTTQLRLELRPLPVEVEGIGAEVERLRLIEPEVTVSHEVTLGRQLVELPIDEIDEAVELTTGVSDGHFRGGRVGQESYLIDGLEIKNQFEASREGPGFELAPSSLVELEVTTGGLGADNGSALSGVVSYVTKRGNREGWEGRAAISTDFVAPDATYTGFNGFSGSIGGPLSFLGEGTTMFADILAQGKIDADPRARGLTCLELDDVEDEALAITIENLANDPSTAHLYCPFKADRLPFQRGDKLIGFFRFDRPLGNSTHLGLSVLYNRRQNELYTPEFKYNDTFQLGQKKEGWLGSATLDWAKHTEGRAYRLTIRGAAMWLDRYLGAVDPWTFDGRARIGGFGIQSFRFIGEDFVRSPIEEQLAAGTGVPGYMPPGGTTGSPFGPAAEGVFFTEGTPELANWNTSSFLGADVQGEMLTASGHSLRAGGNLRFWRIESYERVAAFLPGSSPGYARFYPLDIDAWGEVSLLALDDVTIELGLRFESFRSGIDFQEDRGDILAPVIDSEFKTQVMPRIGVAVPIPGSRGRTMFRFNYARVAQAPDFGFFLDTTLGDSLRADIRRQGNPNLTFESGTSYEGSVSHLATDRISLTATFFYKELGNLVTSSLAFTGFGENQFTTGDFGTVTGAELVAQARWPGLEARLGYAYQNAKGVTSGPRSDPGDELAERRVEFPLAFDRRHTGDFTVLVGRAADQPDARWGASLTGSIRSGYPLDRRLDEAFGVNPPEIDDRLPWQAFVNLRATRELGSLLCDGCQWRLTAHIRNTLFRDNIVALRRDTGTLAPPLSVLSQVAAEIPDDTPPIPLESPDYSADADINRDGLITVGELRTARFAAALDRSDPSLFFGEATSLRLGLEIVF